MQKPKKNYSSHLSIVRLQALAEKWKPSTLEASTNVFSGVRDFIRYVQSHRATLKKPLQDNKK